MDANPASYGRLHLSAVLMQEALRKKARSERFASQTAGVTGKAVDSEELQKKLAARAERFALEKKAAGGAQAAVLDPEAEAKRQVPYSNPLSRYCLAACQGGCLFLLAFPTPP